VDQITERLVLYTRLDNCKDEEELKKFHHEMEDRFGPVPECVEDLFTTVRCRKLAVELGFERMTLKNKTLRCYFVNNPESPYFHSTTFQSILLHIQTKTNKSHLKQVGKKLHACNRRCSKHEVFIGVSSTDDQYSSSKRINN